MKRFGLLVILVASLVLCACENKDGENADGVVGPGIDVHCAGLSPKGLGDTTVKVTCGPQ